MRPLVCNKNETMKKALIFIPLLVILWMGSIKVDDLLHRRAPLVVAGPESYSVLFKGPALKVLSMGYDTAMADYLYMKMIQYFAYQDDHGLPMTNLSDMAAAITDLDPGFEYAYSFAWSTLVNFDKRPEDTRIAEGGAILRKGWQNNSDSWHLAQDLAFHNFYYEGRFDEAANMYEAAYKLKPYPIFLMLSARLRTQAGDPELALQILKQQLVETKDEKTRQTIEEGIRRVQGEIIARELDKLVEKYHIERGEMISSLNELIRAGYIRKIPPDGMGGTFKWNVKNQEVESTTFGRVRAHFFGDYQPPWKKKKTN